MGKKTVFTFENLWKAALLDFCEEDKYLTENNFRKCTDKNGDWVSDVAKNFQVVRGVTTKVVAENGKKDTERSLELANENYQKISESLKELNKFWSGKTLEERAKLIIEKSRTLNDRGVTNIRFRSGLSKLMCLYQPIVPNKPENWTMFDSFASIGLLPDSRAFNPSDTKSRKLSERITIQPKDAAEKSFLMFYSVLGENKFLELCDVIQTEINLTDLKFFQAARIIDKSLMILGKVKNYGTLHKANQNTTQDFTNLAENIAKKTAGTDFVHQMRKSWTLQ